MKITLDDLELLGAEGSFIRSILRVKGWAFPFNQPFNIEDVTASDATFEQLTWLLLQTNKHDTLLELIDGLLCTDHELIPVTDWLDVPFASTIGLRNAANKLYKIGLSSDSNDPKKFDIAVKCEITELFAKL